MRSKITIFLPVFPVLLLGMILFAVGCGKDESVVIVDPPAPDPPPQQYGTPFDNVPSPGDIVMYEVNPRVFSPSQDLQGITSRLDSLQKLGINVVWLMPIYPTGNERSVGSPYAVRDYMAVNSDYGNLEDLRTLTDRAHELDMAVILDWVANHTAWDNEWISNRSWYVRDAAGNLIHPPGTNWLDVAELNYDNHEMRGEMIRMMKYWVLAANVDGYRCDYASGVPADFWREAVDTLSSLPERDLILFAESGDKSLLNAGFDLIFGWPFYGKLREVFNGRSAGEVYITHQSEYNGLDPDEHVVRWVTNHDEHAWDATPQQIFGGEAAAMAAFILASHMGGAPLVYNGQEVAVPYQLPFFEGHNVAINWSSNPEVKQEYERVLNFRKESEALRSGSLQDFSSADVVAFKRAAGTEEVLVLVNVRDIARDYELPPDLANSTWHDAYDGTEVFLGADLRLDAYKYVVLKN